MIMNFVLLDFLLTDLFINCRLIVNVRLRTLLFPIRTAFLLYSLVLYIFSCIFHANTAPIIAVFLLQGNINISFFFLKITDFI